MPPFLSRLGLRSGAVLTLGEKWFENDELPVGLICEKPETLESMSIEGDDDEGDTGEQVTERTPAHFEVWLLPPVLYEQLWSFYINVYEVLLANPGQFKRVWAKADEAVALLVKVQGDAKLVCRRVYVDQVAFTEERPKFAEAHTSIHAFFADKIVDVSEPLNNPEKLSPPAARLAPQAGAPNGPDAR